MNKLLLASLPLIAIGLYFAVGTAIGALAGWLDARRITKHVERNWPCFRMCPTHGCREMCSLRGKHPRFICACSSHQ